MIAQKRPLIPPPAERRKRRTMSQSDMIECWTDEGFLIPQRVIYLGSFTTDSEGAESGVDAAMARRFEVAMRTLEYFDPMGPITVIMNNPGGNYYHGLAIYDRIMETRCHVTIHAAGHVMSMGSLILQAGDKRLMSRNATMLLHYGASGHTGHIIDHERAGEETKRLRGIAADIFFSKMLKKDSKFTRAQLHEHLLFDTFLDPQKAIRMGLADGLIPQPKHKKVRTQQVNPSE